MSCFIFNVTCSIVFILSLYTTHIDSHQTALSNVVFVVLSQSNNFHDLQAKALKESLNQQSAESTPPVIHLTHQDWPQIHGAWTIFPLIPELVSIHGNNASWIFVTEEFTHVYVKQLVDVLSKFDSSLDWFLGHELHDEQATIIHHFAFQDNPTDFLYPEFAAGFVLSVSLLKKIEQSLISNPTRTDFSIDPKHELALYIQQKLSINLTHVPQLCVQKISPHCATSYSTKMPKCGPPIPNGEIYFAVKTCDKYHSGRIPVVKQTWAKHAAHIGYFSNKFDSSIPTKSFDIPNTTTGHCKKTLAILEHVSTHPDFEHKSWLVVVDDDTILSVTRVRQLLSCYDPFDLVAVGERYGYGVTGERGYNYITGGGGFVLSMKLARLLVESGQCVCPSNETPDDMFLGICLKRLQVPIIHSPLFHQARPVDYSEEYLSHQEPVSFHKHWLVDPVAVYKDWFEETDKQEPSVHRHLEL